MKGLTLEEMSRVLERLSEIFNTPKVAQLAKDDPGRIKTMHVLTGGNPRTVVMLFEILALEANLEGENVRGDLERLLDRCTALYKARFEALPQQSQQVVDALAIHWDPITAGDLAKRMRVDVNTISSQLNRLVKQGILEKVAYYREGAKNPKSKTGFQIAERFFNIWYLMRASRRVRRKLIWLVQFLKLFYSQEELQPRARHHLRSGMHFLMEGTPEFHEKVWPDILNFFREVVTTGKAKESKELLDELELSDRWRPLREALAAIAAGTPDYLHRVAPEIRLPAEELLKELKSDEIRNNERSPKSE
jgi:hypothetical protein